MAEVFNFYVQEDRSIKYKLIEPIMQEDKDVATWRFRIPKVLNNIDMSAWAWWFVYVNAKNQKFSELLFLNDDIDDPDNFSTADYSIGYGISKTPGGFTFALEAISTSQGGEISGEWHTRTYTHTVTPTLQGNQAEYVETESDIISALMQEVRNKVNQLVGGATPLPVNLKSQMTDHDKVYLYTGVETGESTGYWYYWNGTEFVPGGLYAAGIQIDATLSKSGQAADAKAVGDKITSLKEDFTEISKAHNAVVETVNGKSDSGDIPFEIGSIAIGSSGWTFSSSTKRARICEGYTITMRPGDKLGFKSYSNIRYYIGWNRENDTYGTMGRWLQEDFQASEWGKVTICISNTPEVTISDITTITDLFFIERLNSIETSLIKHNVKGINHKGYSFVAPENTLPAYALSKKMGYEYVECDVQFTSDDVPVLLHNSSINATARNADGSAISTTVNVGETAYNDLLQYDFGIWKGDEYAGTKIPTFEEFIRFCKYSGLKPYCEIKGDTMTEARIKLLTDIVIKNGMQKSVTWISFAVNALYCVKNNIPTARLGIISATLTASVISNHHELKSDSNDVFVDLEISAVTDENVATLISEGIETETYTVDKLSAIKNVNPYITGITTNCVDVVGALASYAKTLA